MNTEQQKTNNVLIIAAIAALLLLVIIGTMVGKNSRRVDNLERVYRESVPKSR